MSSYKSSEEKKGRIVNQIITSIHGVKKTFNGVRTETIQEGSFCKFDLVDGRYVMVNIDKVLCVEVFGEDL